MGDREISYEKLKNESKKVNEKLDKLLEEKSKPNKRLKYDGFERNVCPTEFEGNVKYLFLNINPSLKEDKGKDIGVGPTLEIVDEEKFSQLGENDFKEIDGKFTFRYFFKKPFRMIKEIDGNACVWWEHPNYRSNVLESCNEWEKTNEIERQVIEKLREENNYNGLPKNPSYIVFAELLYYRHPRQKEIQGIIESNSVKEVGDIQNELRKNITDLLKKQLKYYSPEYIIITNSYVSKFFLKEILEKPMPSRISDIPTVEDYGKTKVFFSTMFSSGNLDNFSLKRLQREIESEINKDLNSN